jgi:hypothetical protein
VTETANTIKKSKNNRSISKKWYVFSFILYIFMLFLK